MILISPEPSTKVELYVLQMSMEKLVQRLAFLNSTDWRTKPPHLCKNNILTSSSNHQSRPPLSSSGIQASEAYLFLLPHDKIAHTATYCGMRYRSTHLDSHGNSMDNPNPDTTSLVPTGLFGDLFCDPVLLPTPMAILRLLVPSTQRRLGIVRRLLTTASRTFIHGCPLDPEKGSYRFLSTDW